MSRYKMSDVAVEINERENSPATSKYDRFVGLEHYVSGDVIIRNFGSTERLESTMKVFQNGDVLVARRNVYLKRASMVDFDGLTSGDSIVLRAKDPVIGRILPFVLNTDKFWDFADQYSDGTMSKRLSPKTLMKYEFDLPAEDELEAFADLLWAANDTKEAYQALLRQTDELVKSQFIEMFGDASIGQIQWKKITVRDAVSEGYIARPLDGNHGEKHPKGDDYVESGVPFLMAQDLKDKQVDFGSCHFITEKQSKTLKKGWAKPGDVLITHKGTIGRVAIVQPSEYTEMLLTPQITYYRCLKDIDNEYLAAYFLTDYFVNQLQGMITGTTRASVTITQQENLELIIPPMDMQRKFVEFVKQSDKSKFELKKAIENTAALIKSLMQQDLSQ